MDKQKLEGKFKCDKGGKDWGIWMGFIGCFMASGKDTWKKLHKPFVIVNWLRTTPAIRFVSVVAAAAAYPSNV